MKFKIIVLAFVSIICGYKSNGQSFDCDNVLTAKTIHVLNSETRSKLAWMNLVNEQNYESKKEEASAIIPGYFSGSWSSFAEKRSELYKEQNYMSDEYESRQELRIELPKEAFDKWIKCVEINSNGLFFTIEDIDSKGATLRVDWKPAPGLSGQPLINITVELEGAKPSTFEKISNINVGTSRYKLTRVSENTIIRGILNGKINGDNYSQKIYIPNLKTEIKQIPIEICSCVGHGGVEGVTFWGPKGEPCNGIASWGTYSQNCQKVTQICKCQGHGGVEGVTMWGPKNFNCGGIETWGKYSGLPVNISKIKVSNFQKFCSCIGKGDILNGMTLWGPNGEFCGGIQSWGDYDFYCR
jgi:hypothetical protein